MIEKKVRWVVQSNLLSENDIELIKDACDQLDIEFFPVKVIPFSTEIPYIPIDKKFNIYYGSTLFIDNVNQKLNNPKGIFYSSEEFTMSNYINKWGNHLLSSEAQITNFNELCAKEYDVTSEWFIRPNADDKSFAGIIMDFQSIKDWKNKFQQFDSVELNEKTEILVGPAYHIKKEWRNFIVDKKIISSSLYRKDHKLYISSTDIPNEMLQFVLARCEEYTPNSIFVMDIGLCGDNYYIIECGCMNSAGFYLANVNSIVKAVSESLSEK